ncbi:MAG: hypothetical protein A2020_00365 [Lentisphaerae bacterium GWF2_45_14]|nr:MAG: hypothetical protein A2020_00365 [Lentisphaerae bacterium GWF2_45_14]
MPSHQLPRHSPAWYCGTRTEFLGKSSDEIANQLAGRAVAESLEIEAAQSEEWRQSVNLLQKSLDERIPIIREALMSPGCEAVRHVILEYDFHRRGLRMDCLLLSDGALFVIEFKRSKLQRADRDQVMNYAVNLIEFHRVTQDWCKGNGAIVVPVLALTEGKVSSTVKWTGLAGHSWPALAYKPLECDKNTLHEAIRLGLKYRRSYETVSLTDWIDSPFRPSSSILDATLSLYGNHDVAAIQEHAAPKAAIEASVKEIRAHIDSALVKGKYHIVFLSGAPGAGKTLVGLDIVMRGNNADGSVFVTGNAPLVEVLNKALDKSYRTQGRNATAWTPTGYRHADARFVTGAANFKIVKAHNFLGKRGEAHRQEDGRVLVFDEAQRTYEKGRRVLGEQLTDHEADLILSVQRKAYPTGGAVIVALIGHNQAINSGERGIVAWLDAAERNGWTFSIGDKTLELAEFTNREKWALHTNRSSLQNGHLHQSMRYYRNAKVEEWVSAVLDGDSKAAQSLANILAEKTNTIWLTRSLEAARKWAKFHTVGSQRSGLIASGQARRLAAEGLFVDYKPDIAPWMLAPSSDVRSSNSLETVQNQYFIQGLELDNCVVCWDADLRRKDGKWAAYKLSRGDWQKDKLIDVAKNGYRVLLTRARKGIVIFVPRGDLTGEDVTRNIEFYDGIWEFLKDCGAKELES